MSVDRAILRAANYIPRSPQAFPLDTINFRSISIASSPEDLGPRAPTLTLLRCDPWVGA